MRITQRAIAAAAGIAIAGGLFLAAAGAQEQDTTTLIHERQQLMKTQGGAMKTIGGFVQGGIGTLDDVAAAAGVLIDASAKSPDLFPTGTSMDEVTVPETGAKAVIWERWDEFVAASDTLGSEATVVRDLAMAGDVDGLAAAFDSLGNNGCGGCHQTFRQKLE